MIRTTQLKLNRLWLATKCHCEPLRPRAPATKPACPSTQLCPHPDRQSRVVFMDPRNSAWKQRIKLAWNPSHDTTTFYDVGTTPPHFSPFFPIWAPINQLDGLHFRPRLPMARTRPSSTGRLVAWENTTVVLSFIEMIIYRWHDDRWTFILHEMIIYRWLSYIFPWNDMKHRWAMAAENALPGLKDRHLEPKRAGHEFAGGLSQGDLPSPCYLGDFHVFSHRTSWNILATISCIGDSSSRMQLYLPIAECSSSEI